MKTNDFRFNNEYLESAIEKKVGSPVWTNINLEGLSAKNFDMLKKYVFRNFNVRIAEYDSKNKNACFVFCGYVDQYVFKYYTHEGTEIEFDSTKFKDKLEEILIQALKCSSRVVFAEEGCLQLSYEAGDQISVYNIKECLNNCNFITNDGYVLCRVVNDKFYNEILKIEENLCFHEELRDYFRKNESFSIKELTDLGMKEGISFFIIPVAVWGNEQSILFRTKGNHFFYLGMSKIASSDYFIITDPFEYLRMKLIFRLHNSIEKCDKELAEKFRDFMNAYYFSL